MVPEVSLLQSPVVQLDHLSDFYTQILLQLFVTPRLKNPVRTLHNTSSTLCRKM
jgi:hypothetical protein